VREALARLESDGLVTKRPLHGYTAAPLLDQHGVDELFEMRLILEPEATRRAAINLNREQRATLDESVKEMRKIVASTHTSKNRFENYKAFASLDALFHEIIAEGSGNRMLTDAIVRLRAHRHNYRLHFDQGMTFETLAEHKIVLDALRKSDPESSERAMRSHILCSKERITSAIDRVC
jgi:DNA-binding GntR family transcriptional regulator